MAIIFGLLLGVALLLGMLVFRSRCFSCALNPPPRPGSPMPRQKLQNAVPTAFPPTSPRTPEYPPLFLRRAQLKSIWAPEVVLGP